MNPKSFTGSSKKKERLALMSWLPKLRWARVMGRRGLGRPDRSRCCRARLATTAKASTAQESSPLQSVDPASVTQRAAAIKNRRKKLIKAAYIPDNYICVKKSFWPHTDRGCQNLTAARDLCPGQLSQSRFHSGWQDCQRSLTVSKQLLPSRWGGAHYDF